MCVCVRVCVWCSELNVWKSSVRQCSKGVYVLNGARGETRDCLLESNESAAATVQDPGSCCSVLSTLLHPLFLLISQVITLLSAFLEVNILSMPRKSVLNVHAHSTGSELVMRSNQIQRNVVAAATTVVGESQRESQREREPETERDRQTDRERERERERD